MARQNNHTPARPTQPVSPPPPELIEKFLSLQQQELQLRTEELAISAQQEANNRTIAEASIAAQLEDRNNERSHRERRTKQYFIGASILTVIVLAFIGFSLYLGKEAFVVKAMEIIGTFVAGFIGGFGFKSSRPPKRTDIEE